MKVLQEGIYWGQNQKTPASFGVLFLSLRENAAALEVNSGLNALWSGLQEFKRKVNKGVPERNIPSPELTILLAYGQEMFKIDGVRRELPAGLWPRSQFRTLKPGVEHAILPGAGLSYERDLRENRAQSAIALQFVAHTQTAVERSLVESWRILAKDKSVSKAFKIGSYYRGFQPKDGRSWIGFHDGISNLRRGEERRQVITVKQTRAQDAWTQGGCYLVYMRMPIDLEVWEALSMARQESLVGRDKPSGCPVTGVMNAEGDYAPISVCPPRPPEFFEDQSYDPYREPPAAVDDVIKLSHVQRANHHSFDFENPDSLRIYRQGYEFSEGIVGGKPRVGLNFVSFVDTPDRVMNLLTRKDWLGGVNFGECADGSAPVITHVGSAGCWFVPSKHDGESYPGEKIFRR